MVKAYQLVAATQLAVHRIGGLHAYGHHGRRKSRRNMNATNGSDIVYLIAAGEHYKIGRTRNLKGRLRYAQTFTATDLKVLATWHVPSNTRLLERYLHNRFAHVRLRGEWFALSRGAVSDLLAVDHWDIDLIREVIKTYEPKRAAGSLLPMSQAQKRQRQIRRKGRLWTCQRCGWQWKTLSGKRPKRCAEVKCRSPYWDQRRTDGHGHV
jgi:hypothetical protein